MNTLENNSILKPVEISMDEMGKMISNLEDRIITRIDDSEERVTQKITDLEKNVNFRFDGMSRQIDDIYLSYTTRREHDVLRDRVQTVERNLKIA